MFDLLHNVIVPQDMCHYLVKIYVIDLLFNYTLSQWNDFRNVQSVVGQYWSRIVLSLLMTRKINILTEKDVQYSFEIVFSWRTVRYQHVEKTYYRKKSVWEVSTDVPVLGKEGPSSNLSFCCAVILIFTLKVKISIFQNYITMYQ